MLIIAIVVLADTHRLGSFSWLCDFPFGDKVGHFLLFGLLSLLMNLAVNQRGHAEEPWRLVLRASIVLVLLIGFEGFSQRSFPARISSWADLAASYLGVSSCAWAALQIAKRRAAKTAGNLA